MTKWLTIIGMGEDGFEGLSARAKLALQNADVIVGSERLLGFLPALKGRAPGMAAAFFGRGRSNETPAWPQHRDPRHRRSHELRRGAQAARVHSLRGNDIIPHLSAFSHAAARVGWSIPDCDTLTLHGRDAANIEAFIQPGAKLIVLTADASTIPEVARRLVARGFEKSPITVLENMGGAREAQTSFMADAVPKQQFSDLNTLAVECIAGTNAKIWSRLAGLPDEAFVHDGQLTKREVRAATLAALAPAPDQLLWDVGAGCGSVAIEWMRSTRGCEALAFEHHEDRLKMIAANADQLGTPRLKIIAGEVPEYLAGQTPPRCGVHWRRRRHSRGFRNRLGAFEIRRPHGGQCRHHRGRNASLRPAGKTRRRSGAP